MVSWKTSEVTSYMVSPPSEKISDCELLPKKETPLKDINGKEMSLQEINVLALVGKTI